MFGLCFENRDEKVIKIISGLLSVLNFLNKAYFPQNEMQGLWRQLKEQSMETAKLCVPRVKAAILELADAKYISSLCFGVKIISNYGSRVPIAENLSEKICPAAVFVVINCSKQGA
jgi:hypothetical protein